MNEEAIFEAAVTEYLSELPMQATEPSIAFDRGTLLSALRKLRESGMGPFKAIAWLPIVIELLIKYGPQIADLAERVVKVVSEIIAAWRDKNATPQTFGA